MNINLGNYFKEKKKVIGCVWINILCGLTVFADSTRKIVVCKQRFGHSNTITNNH